MATPPRPVVARGLTHCAAGRLEVPCADWPRHVGVLALRADTFGSDREIDGALQAAPGGAAMYGSWGQHPMKRPGARWKHTTGDEVMQLRALQLSDRWGSASSASRSSAMPPALGELASTMKRDETPCNATRTG
jgi:hypothetical protein